jgi:prophage DNA circulation protein
MTNLEQVSKTFETPEGLARKIWLAGLGIYVKSFEEIQNRFEKINAKRARLFKEFTSKGEKITADTNESVTKDVKEETAVDKRVADVRKKLGLDTSDTDAKITELSQKVDALTVMLSKLS